MGPHSLSEINPGIVGLFNNHRFGVESSGTQYFTFILELVFPCPHPSHVNVQSHSVLGLTFAHLQTDTYAHT